MINNKIILFIVEGEKAEVSLLKKLNKITNQNQEFNIFSYKTTIYELYEELSLDENLDILLYLKEKTTDKKDREILSQKYTSKYFIFDFDPHYQKYSYDSLIKMLEFFYDSREFGKLFINYPMLELQNDLLYEDYIYVINTSLFYIIDLKPQTFFKHHQKIITL